MISFFYLLFVKNMDYVVLWRPTAARRFFDAGGKSLFLLKIKSTRAPPYKTGSIANNWMQRAMIRGAALTIH